MLEVNTIYFLFHIYCDLFLLHIVFMVISKVIYNLNINCFGKVNSVKYCYKFILIQSNSGLKCSWIGFNEYGKVDFVSEVLLFILLSFFKWQFFKGKVLRKCAQLINGLGTHHIKDASIFGPIQQSVPFTGITAICVLWPVNTCTKSRFN